MHKRKLFTSKHWWLAKTKIAGRQTSRDSSYMTHHYVTAHIKTEHYLYSLTLIRKHLAPSQQIFSRLIHQPFIDITSEFLSKTLFRPSGLLGGSIFSLIGSLIVIMIARHIGFSLPNSLFITLFTIGFGFGIIIEILIRVTDHSNSK
jgi:hypothetical protein